MLKTARFVLSMFALLGVSSCSTMRPSHGVVGAWFVEHSSAPFKYHMYVFNADGTMQQANPDAGNARTSDSDGKGIWVAQGHSVKGKFVEITADRTTHAFLSRGEISFDFLIHGDSFTGTATGRFFDLSGKLIDGPFATDMKGSRVTLP